MGKEVLNPMENKQTDQVNKEVKNSDLFYCYDISLFKFLHNEKSIRYITHAIHPKTRKDFWLFSVCNVSEAIKEYNIKNRIA